MYHKIAQTLKKLRKASNFSQEELAEKLGCSREFVSRIENNHENISLKMLFQEKWLFSEPH